MYSANAISSAVIPVFSGIHFDFASDSLHAEKSRWIPAFAGMAEPG